MDRVQSPPISLGKSFDGGWGILSLPERAEGRVFEGFDVASERRRSEDLVNLEGSTGHGGGADRSLRRSNLGGNLTLESLPPGGGEPGSDLES